MGGGKDGSISQIAQGCQPGNQQIFKVGTPGYQNQLKKNIYLKKKVQPKIQLSVPDYLVTEIKRSKKYYFRSLSFFFSFQITFSSKQFILDEMFYVIYIVYSWRILEKSRCLF